MDLTWNEGNIWKATIKYSDYFEGKYVLKRKSGKLDWEGGENRKFDVKKIINELKKSSIDSYSSDHTVYRLSTKEKKLIIKSDWKFS